MSEAIIGRSTVRELVAIYAAAVADIIRAFGVIDSAEERLNESFQSGRFNDVTREIHVGTHWNRLNWSRPDDALKDVRQATWKVIIDRLELRQFLSIKAMDELNKQVEGHKMPEITEASITDIMRSFSSQLPELLTQAVVEVFDWLRPRCSGYKTNSEFEVGKKVIVGYMVSPRWSKEGWDVEYHKAQHLTALENVFSSLDGRGQRTKSHKSEAAAALWEAADGVAVTRYFRFKAYGNRNLHIEFLRPDLLRRFNEIAGGKRLREKAA